MEGHARGLMVAMGGRRAVLIHVDVERAGGGGGLCWSVYCEGIKRGQKETPFLSFGSFLRE